MITDLPALTTTSTPTVLTNASSEVTLSVVVGVLAVVVVLMLIIGTTAFISKLLDDQNGHCVSPDAIEIWTLLSRFNLIVINSGLRTFIEHTVDGLKPRSHNHILDVMAPSLVPRPPSPLLLV